MTTWTMRLARKQNFMIWVYILQYVMCEWMCVHDHFAPYRRLGHQQRLSDGAGGGDSVMSAHTSTFDRPIVVTLELPCCRRESQACSG